MSSIQFGGVVSGLNTQSIIDALVAAEKQPLTDLQTKEATLTAQKAAYSQLGTAVDNVVTAIKNFTVTNAGSSRNATSTDDSVLTASAGPSASVASYQVSVQRVASATRAVSMGAIGTAITGNVDTSRTLDQTTLGTAISSGNMAVTVDGLTLHMAVGDPATTSLQSTIASVTNALQTLLQKTDAGSTVTSSLVGGQLQLAVTGNTTTHSFSFGSVGDTSNAAVALGLDTQSVVDTQNATVTGTANVDPVLTVTVDGNAVQVPLGDEGTTTLQDAINAVVGSLQTQLQATDPSATVSATTVNGLLQLSVTGNTTHSFSFADSGLTSKLASFLGLAGQSVTNQQNATVTGTGYLDPSLSSLNLPGSVTAGQISAIVDGVIVHYTVGDPTRTTLDQLMAGFGQAIQNELRTGGSGGSPAPDAGATATFSVVGNKLQLSISGAAVGHSLSFGAAGDASNALGMLGIANSSASSATTNPTITGATNLGVARMVTSLDSSGISGLNSTTTGVLKINGVAISYDTTKDSLSDVISRINKAGAGVVASVDRASDKLQLTALSTGAVAIDIADDGPSGGNLAAKLNLSPGTTTAQTIGQNALLTVDGRSIVSANNTVTNAIDGVALSLVGQSPIDQTETITVGADTSAVQSALSSFVSSFNVLGDTLDNLTGSTPGTVGGKAGTAGPLANDPIARTLYLNLRDTVMRAVGSGTTNSLGSLGITTGAVGAAVGTTNRLQLNPTQLANALTNDPNAAAGLLDSATGPLGRLLTQLTGVEDPANSQAYIQSNTTSLTDQIKATQSRESVQQEMVDNYTRMIEAQFTAMESTLATLQAQSSQIAAELGTTSSSSSSGINATTTG